MNRSVGRSVENLAEVGLTAQAIVIAAAGVFVLQAAIEFDPKAKGIDGILKSFAHTTLGLWLLVLFACSVLALGLSSLAAARYADI